MPTPTLRVVAIAQTKPGHEETFAAALRACVPPSRNEPGCHEYTAYRDTTSPGRFVVVETWQSHAHLDAHTKTPHYLQLAQTVQHTTQNGVTVMLLEEL